MAFEFYTSVEKGLKLKIRKFQCLILTFVEVTVEKLVGGLPSNLNRVLVNLVSYCGGSPVNFQYAFGY